MRLATRIAFLLFTLFAFGCATAPGPVPLREIGNAIQAHEEHFRNCYERAFKTIAPDVELRVSFDIFAFGKVRNAKRVRNTVPNQTLERCVLGILSAIQFPWPEQGHHFDVIYPFRFKGRDR